MTTLVCEPMIHAVAYCENKAFFKQSSEALIQGLLPGNEEAEDFEEMSECENEEKESEEDENSDEEEGNSEDSIDDENEESLNEEEESVDEDVDFDSEEFDNINNDGNDCGDSHCCDGHDHSECSEEEEEEGEESFVFDYSLLAKFIFDFGAREDVLVRNRRFLYELSQLIEQVATGTFESCCDETCHNQACCN